MTLEDEPIYGAPHDAGDFAAPHPAGDGTHAPGGGESPDQGSGAEGSPVARSRVAWRVRSQTDLPQLLLLWCLWLLCSWIVIRKIQDFTVHVLPGGMLSPPGPPTAKWMLYAALIGMMLIWPAFRLSQRWGRDGRKQETRDSRAGEEDGTAKTRGDRAGAVAGERTGHILLDWVGMMLLLQVVLWPLQHIGEWSLTQMAWIDAMIACWSLLTGVIMVCGMRYHSAVARTTAMLLCVALLFIEPLILALMNAGGWMGSWLLTVSPLDVLSGLTVPRYDFSPQPWLNHIYGAAAAAIVAWLIVAVVAWRGRSRDV